MTINLPETRRQYAIATRASGYSLLSTWAIFAGPPLMDAADELARVKAVLEGDDAENAIALIMRAHFGVKTEGASSAAFDALAALRELIARDG